MTTAFPSSWQQVEIGDVALVIGGGTPPAGDPTNFEKAGSGTPWLTPADLSGYRGQYISQGARNLSAAGLASSSAKLLPKGTVLFSSRAPVGYVAIADCSLTTNQGFKSFVFTPAVEPRFAYYQLKHLRPVAEAMATGTTFKELSGSAAAKLPFLIAPAETQRRIADKLDTVLARVDACRDRLARVAPLLKRFRQSVLAAATSGRLTEEWRARRLEISTNALTGLPATWLVKRASEVVEPGADIVYGIVQPGPKLTTGIPYVRGMDIVDGRIQVDQLLRTSPEIAKRYARASIRGGDVLLGIIRATKVAVVPDELSGANITQGTARFRPSSILSTNFLAIVLEAPETQSWLHAHYRGIDMPGLNLADVRRIPIPLPPLDEQAEIVRRVKTFFGFADRLEARLAQAQSAVERLTPSLLAKAFRGELVPQDPDDEPAAELLKRLAAQRDAAPRRTRRSRVAPPEGAATP